MYFERKIWKIIQTILLLSDYGDKTSFEIILIIMQTFYTFCLVPDEIEFATGVQGD